MKLSTVEKFFPPNNRLHEIKIAKSSVYSMSTNDSGKLLHDIVKSLIGNSGTITDATANIGSDSIKLATYGYNVNAIELEKKEYKFLNHNIKLYNLDVKTYNDSALNIIPKIKQDIIYIDEGSVDYK